MEEVALYLNLKPSKIRSMVFRRELPYIKIGRLVRFQRQEIDAWIASLRAASSVNAGRGMKDESIFEIGRPTTRFNRALSKGEKHD
ncbi:MAG: helix-turn-helix domain-containing protein [Bdellovibrionota bacterium]